ncbi:MAG: isoprenylcysteine carboxylmethyltransferase family protein [Gammaproteobacteria bacterium]|nr:isoprenylcysteine carboxylmethyltransferase family protein [Gammaproteobacteria bacterium]MDH5629601.1 isoprenylcysteine carboxylmethyltransferase family protein [Gammaproteobacteria bacterium]
MLKLKIPPPIYTLLTATIMWWLNQHYPLKVLFEGNWTLMGYGFIAFGLLFDSTALVKFMQNKTSINPIKPEKASQLVTSGLYRLTRNPMYFGLLLLLTGWGILLGSLAPLLMIPLFVWVITSQQIKPEEAILQQKFGQAYLDYKQQVRRWI